MRFIPILILATLAACSQIQKDSSYMSQLSDTLSKVYSTDQIKISIQNGEELEITFKNTEYFKMSPEQKREMADKIAEYATCQELGARKFTTGSLAFETSENYIVYSSSKKEVISLEVQ